MSALMGGHVNLSRPRLTERSLKGDGVGARDSIDAVWKLPGVVTVLDYAAIGPEHSYLRDAGRITYDYATDDEALAAFRTLAETEGIIPALETAHAIAHVIKIAPSMSSDKLIIVNCSGRGDKDADHFGV